MNYATSSGLLAAGTSVLTTLGASVSSVMLVGGSAASTITLYESADGTASGTVLAALACASSGFASVNLHRPVACNKQLVAVVAGTAATAVVHYALGV